MGRAGLPCQNGVRSIADHPPSLPGFKLYLLLGLSSAFRCIGFAARAAQLNDPTNTDLAAVSLVFRQVSGLWGRACGTLPLLVAVLASCTCLSLNAYPCRLDMASASRFSASYQAATSRTRATR